MDILNDLRKQVIRDIEKKVWEISFTCKLNMSRGRTLVSQTVYLNPKLYLRIIILISIMGLSFLSWTESVFADEMEKMTLQLRWEHQFQFSGYYAAKWLGYYEDEGLDVEIKSGFTEDHKVIYAPKEVAEERADFGIGAVDILIAMDKGADLSLIASVFQRSAVEFYLKSSTPYGSIVDLTKLNTARRRDDLLDIELQAMLISEGITPDKSILLEDNIDFSIDHLLDGRFDVIPGYLGTIYYYGNKAGVDLKTIKPIDYGIDFYGDSLFTRKSLVQNNPELVERFRRASMKGWKYALEHPEEMVRRIAEEFTPPEKSTQEFIEYNLYQAEKVAALTLYPVVEIGNVNPYRWEKMHETLLKLDLVEEGLDIDRFVFSYEKMIQAKSKKIEKTLIVILIESLIILGIFFMIHLTAKNKALKGEVAERKRAEEKILRSKQRYQAIFNSAVLGIIITTGEGVILQANEKCLQMTGYTENEFIGKNIFEIIESNDKGTDSELMEGLMDNRIERWELERKCIDKDGNPFWGKFFMTSIYDQDSERILNLGMILDISNEKIEEEAVRRSEDRFRRIIKEVASGISDIESADRAFNGEEPYGEIGSDSRERNQLSLKLEKINLKLEKMFKKELDENRKKEALIIYQARLAAMGEMIANIAHQWRQPLNNLGLVLSNIEDDFLHNELDADNLHVSIEKSRKLIEKMSDTIDDFRYFLNPEKDKKEFSIYETILTVLDLLEENLRFHQIRVVFEKITLVTSYGYANQYSQAIFNIIHNAIDALASTDKESKNIHISIFEEEHMIVASIEDNGGGIHKDIGNKIFDMYFTTKQSSKGTGLGLYMTKMIIENTMNGRISWKNTESGLEMGVAIPNSRGEDNGNR